MMFSQGIEEEYITNFFGNTKGRLLDIGAFHPETFSNSRKLILDGWEAVLVEPSPKCFKTIEDFYMDNESVRVFNVALNTYDGEMVFYDSAGAVATGCKDHYERWKEIQKDFVETKVPCLSWEKFYNYMFKKRFDFISIDAEGMDWEILKQIDLDETETKLVCIEYSYNFSDIINYLAKFNFGVIYNNAENLIVGR
jgi:FkbM family methyltransferase